MEPGTIVIATLTNPHEKIWGALRELKAEGITVQGIRVDSFDDFVRQAQHPGELQVPVSTTFYPMHRVVSVEWDKTDADLASFADHFRQKVGVTMEEYLSARTT
ncbi:MAG: hypothetical protein ACRD06_06270 [Terriglobia bacterium]